MTTANMKHKGFTLTEVLVVILIMGIVSGLVIVAAKGARRKADYDGARAGIQLIAAKIDSYYNKRGNLPYASGGGATTEMSIYKTLSDWGFEVPPANQVDPWGHPYVIILQGDYADGTTTPPYGKTFDLVGNTMGYNITEIAGKSYLNIALANMKNLYVNVPAAMNGTLQQKAIHKVQLTDPCYQNQNDGFQIISAGPDGKICVYDSPADNNSNCNADNITNWQK